jgi:hypothetical protein
MVQSMEGAAEFATAKKVPFWVEQAANNTVII